MNTETTNMTALGGRLRRTGPGAWVRADGTPEPRVRDLRLADIAPNYRCTTYGDGKTYVEVPATWQRDVADEDVAAAIGRLTAGLDLRRLFHGRGYFVPVLDWDAEMNAVVGASWATADQAALLALPAPA